MKLKYVHILIFLCQATQGDRIRLLYYFEQCTHFFGCVGSCGYVPPSVKTKYLPKWVAHICNKKMSASTIDLQK